MKKNLYINDVSLGDYGVYISSDTVLNAPMFDYVEHEIPGRDGAVLQYNKRMSNVIRRFTCYVPQIGNPASAITDVKRLIYSNPGYVKLESDYETGYYQMGYLAQPIEVEPFNRYKTATFDLYFSCMPKKYAETQATGSGTYGLFDNQFVYQGIYPRSNHLVQQVFSNIEPSYIPSDEYFYIFYVSFGNITDADISWSEGNMPLFLFEADLSGLDYDIAGVRAYSNTTIVGDVSAENGLYLLCPVFLTGTLSMDFKDADSVSRNYTTNDISNNVLTLTQTDAFGCSFDTFDIEYRPMNAFGIHNAEVVVFIESYLHERKTGSMAISLKLYDLGTMLGVRGADNYRTLVSSGSQNVYKINANINLDEQTAVFTKQGSPDLPAGSYIQFVGDLGSYDTVKIFAPASRDLAWYNTALNPGYGDPYQFNVSGKWWSL